MDGRSGEAIDRSVVEEIPVASVDADIIRIGHDIEGINRAIAAYELNAQNKDAEIKEHIDRLDDLYTQLEDIPEEILRSSDEFNKRITTMKVNVLKSIQLAFQKVSKRSPSQVPVSAKLQGLVSDREYTEQELQLFAVASGLIRKFQGIQSVGFDQLSPQRQTEIDKFIDNYVDQVMTQHVGPNPDNMKQYREEMQIFKKLCQDLLSQIIGEDSIPEEELRRKFLAMVCIIVISQSEGFDANLTLLLSAVGKKEATKVAISAAAAAAAAVLNPAITGTATTGLSVLGEGLTVAGTSALGSIRAAVSAAWLTCASIRGLQLRHNEDWMFRRVLGGINDERRQIALDRIFGPRGQVVGGLDAAYLLRTLGRYGASIVCGQVDVMWEMANDFADLPRTFLNGCKKIKKAATTKIGALARKMIAAKKGEHVNPILLSRSGEVIDELLQLQEFQPLATDLVFTNHIKERVNYLDHTKGIRTSHLEEFLAHEIGIHGVSSAWRRQIKDRDSAPSDWTDQGDSIGNPETVAIKESVLGQHVDAVQLPTTITDYHGAVVGSLEPATAQHLNTGRDYGSQLIRNMDDGYFDKGPASGVGPDGRIHAGFPDFKNRKPVVREDRSRSPEGSGVPEGQEARFRPPRDGKGSDRKGRDGLRRSERDRGGNGHGGKRTRRRKATTKKQQSKKNKRQSRRKSRRKSCRSSSRKERK